MKHTPGPWHAGSIRLNGHNPKMDGCDIGADNGANVALALHQQSDRDTPETVANAKLIAAAPELLDALKGILEAHHISQQASSAWDNVRAAIAKAES